jgi:hypothetical protein
LKDELLGRWGRECALRKESTYNVGHTSLVTKHGGEMDGLGPVIHREGFNFSSVSGSLLSIKEEKNKVGRSGEVRYGALE